MLLVAALVLLETSVALMRVFHAAIWVKVGGLGCYVAWFWL